MGILGETNSTSYLINMTPEEQMKLEIKAEQISPKHKEFCEEFLKDFNGTQAALRTKSFKTQDANAAHKRASITLQREDVTAYLTLRQREFLDLQGLTQRWVLSALEGIAMASITDVLEWEGYSDGHTTVIPSKDIPKNIARAIAEVNITETELPAGITVRRTEVKMVNRLPALRALAAYSGLTNEFNTIRLALKRYGLAMVPDEANPTGWAIQPSANAVN